MFTKKLLLLAFILAVPAFSLESFPVQKIEHFLVLSKVYLNGQGPFRMILDTGAESSTITPQLAARIGATPEYRLEQVTLAGQTTRTAGHVDVQLASTTQRVEMIFSPIPHRAADGILGQSWLRHHSYLLDFDRQLLTLDGPAPTAGLPLPASDAAGRPAIEVVVDGTAYKMVLDSGAPALVIFSSSTRFDDKVLLQTNSGTITASSGLARLQIGPRFRRSFQTVAIPTTNDWGLLPASLFRAVYVEKGAAQLVLLPK